MDRDARQKERISLLPLKRPATMAGRFSFDDGFRGARRQGAPAAGVPAGAGTAGAASRDPRGASHSSSDIESTALPNITNAIRSSALSVMLVAWFWPPAN